MAAAALSRSRGVAGVRATKGLFFIFTLLSLVCLASSWIEKGDLKTLKENLEKSQQKLDSLKANYNSDMAFSSDIMNDYMRLMDKMIAREKKNSAALPNDFPSVEGLLQTAKGFMENTKAYVDWYNEKNVIEIENLEQRIAKYKKNLEYLEDKEADL